MEPLQSAFNSEKRPSIWMGKASVQTEQVRLGAFDFSFNTNLSLHWSGILVKTGFLFETSEYQPECDYETGQYKPKQCKTSK